MDNHPYCVLMAGGRGERFWPHSRVETPKQVLKIGSDQPLLVESVERLFPLIPEENVFISTGEHLEQSFRRVLSDYPKLGWIVEPAQRDTAAAIGFALAKIRHQVQDDFVAVILGSDYRITNPAVFRKHLEAAVRMAQEGSVVTLGIKPTRPATGYGYLRKGELVRDEDIPAYSVGEFKEKPDLQQAQEYLEVGSYLWNSGMFITSASVMLAEIKKYLPDHHAGFERLASVDFDPAVTQEVFEGLPKISIDFGVMEKTDRLLVLESSFNWDDLGDWRALDRIIDHDSNGNAVNGLWAGLETKNCLIVGDKTNPDRLIATLGVSDLIVVDTPDALLVCDRGAVANMKELVHHIRDKGTLQKFL